MTHKKTENKIIKGDIYVTTPPCKKQHIRINHLNKQKIKVN